MHDQIEKGNDPTDFERDSCDGSESNPSQDNYDLKELYAKVYLELKKADQ